MIVEVVNASEHPLPHYATDGSSCMDLRAWLPAPRVVAPFERVMVNTGLRFAIPVGYEVQIRGRSGLAMEKGLVVPNSPGTIDADYRGEVKVLLINLSTTSCTIKNGERIAQMVLGRSCRAIWREVASLPPTTRGSGGFGSTGLQ